MGENKIGNYIEITSYLWNIVDMVRLMDRMGEEELGEEEEYDMVNIQREYRNEMMEITCEMIWYMIIEDVKER